MKRFLRNYFPEKSQFIEFLCSSLGVTPEALPTTNISKEKFKTIMTGLLGKLDQKIDNRLLQGFFSNFSYNKLGDANAQSIAEHIFNETNIGFHVRVLKRLKGPPPCYDGTDKHTIEVSQEEQALRK